MRERFDFITLEDLYQTLIELREELTRRGASAEEHDLRGNELKLLRERYHAAMFARAWQGANKIEKISVGFPKAEYCEYDVFLLWMDGAIERGLLVQLKEFTPAELNPDDSLDGVIAAAVMKYGRAPNLVVAVFINRPGRYETVTFPPHGLGGLFIYGICSLEPKLIYIAGEIGRRQWRAEVPLEIYRKPEPPACSSSLSG